MEIKKSVFWKRLWLVFGVGLLSFSRVADVAAKDSIFWADVVLPPIHHISEGPNYKNGVSDNITKLLIEKLTDYDHQEQILPIQRMFHVMQKENNVCNTSLKQSPERDQFMYYSIPAVYVPAHGIAVRKKDVHLYGEPPVSLEKLLTTTDLKLGIVSDRVYGGTVDSLLQKHKDSKNITERGAADSYGKQVEMMLLGRLDYVLGYAVEFGFAGGQTGKMDQLNFLPVQEAGDYSTTYVACSKTPEGKKIIDRINEVLVQERPSERYRNFVEMWLDKDFIPKYREAYDKNFLTVTQ